MHLPQHTFLMFSKSSSSVGIAVTLCKYDLMVSIVHDSETTIIDSQ